jgi:hypothetical protein
MTGDILPLLRCHQTPMGIDRHCGTIGPKWGIAIERLVYAKQYYYALDVRMSIQLKKQCSHETLSNSGLTFCGETSFEEMEANCLLDVDNQWETFRNIILFRKVFIQREKLRRWERLGAHPSGKTPAAGRTKWGVEEYATDILMATTSDSNMYGRSQAQRRLSKSLEHRCWCIDYSRSQNIIR